MNSQPAAVGKARLTRPLASSNSNTSASSWQQRYRVLTVGREAEAHGRLLGRKRRDLLEAVGLVDRRVVILVGRHHHVFVVGRHPHAPHLSLRGVGAVDRNGLPQHVAAGIDHVELGRGLRADVERCAVRRDRQPFHHVRDLDAVDHRAAGDVDRDNVILLDRREHLAGRMADRHPMGGGADVDLLHLVAGGIDHQHRVAELARGPDHAGGVDHHAVRRVDVAEVDHARQRLRGQVDHHDAPVRVDALGEDAVAIDRGVGGAAVERERDLVGRAGHVERRRHVRTSRRRGNAPCGRSWR